MARGRYSSHSGAFNLDVCFSRYPCTSTASELECGRFGSVWWRSFEWRQLSIGWKFAQMYKLWFWYTESSLDEDQASLKWHLFSYPLLAVCNRQMICVTRHMCQHSRPPRCGPCRQGSLDRTANNKNEKRHPQPPQDHSDTRMMMAASADQLSLGLIQWHWFYY